MTLHPQVVAYLEQLQVAALAPPWEIGPAAARERARAGLGQVPPGPELPRVEDRVMAGPAGEIELRIYWPEGPPGAPMLVWFHGGGWVLGSVEASDPLCRRLAHRSGAIVVSVEYRLAPEDPAPAPFDDCYAATRWVVAHAAELAGDRSRLAVGGASAGGNLAAAVALHARDHGGPAIAHQLLFYPVTDSRMDSDSYERAGEGFGLSRDSMRWYWDCYVPAGGQVARGDLRVSPAHATDLSGLPSAQVITAEYDPLADEGAAYAARLGAAGVPVRTERVPGHLHGFLNNAHLFDRAEQSITAAAEELRRALSGAAVDCDC